MTIIIKPHYHMVAANLAAKAVMKKQPSRLHHSGAGVAFVRPRFGNQKHSCTFCSFSTFPKNNNLDLRQVLETSRPKAPLRLFSSSDEENSVNQNSNRKKPLTITIPTAQDMEEVGSLFSAIVLEDCFENAFTSTDSLDDASETAMKTSQGSVMFLDGDLGAGKTSFARGFLRASTGDDTLRVTSPTYLLTNVYPIMGGKLE